MNSIVVGKDSVVLGINNVRKVLDRDSPDFDSSKLLSPEETSFLLGVAVGTLSVWRSSGRYALNYVKCGRLVRYRVLDILDFLERRTVSRQGGLASGY